MQRSSTPGDSLAQAVTSPTSSGTLRQAVDIVLISALILFLELLLIRWVATELRIFAYLQNTILVVCFLGLGMGCFSSAAPFRLRDALVPLLILTGLLAIPPVRHALSHATQFLAAMPDFIYWSRPELGSVPKTLLALVCGGLTSLAVLVLVWDIFVPLGRLLAVLIDTHPRLIRAYSLNVAGSLVGSWLFVALSVWQWPPLGWFALLALLAAPFVAASGPDRRLNALLLVVMGAASVLAGVEPGAIEARWSPYQKLALYPSRSDQPGTWMITVNNAGYQVILNLDPDHVAANPDLFPDNMRGLSQYDIPCRLHPAPRRVLIVGAGSGNDAAGALRHPGVESVTAVEIDPAIVALGRRHHPERPYDDPRVTVVVDDARAYFAACREQFDIICFGLLDSHTTGVLNNTRLDHYVYTRESLAQARSLLREGGVMVLSFEAARPFIADRMAGVIRQEFEQELLCFRIPPGPYGWGGVQFVAGDLQAVESSLERNPQLAGLIAGWQQRDPVPLTYQTKVLTDDWPYIYLERPGIPSPYAIVCLLMVILYWRGSRTVAQPVAVLRWSREHWHFFLLGAAFMLLEVQNISKAAVVLGSTWWVNAVIISGVLLMVLLANGIAARFPSFPLFPVYGAIWVTCAALYFIDLADFAALPFGPRAVVVGTLTTLPMLFSGVVFIRSFAASSNKREALGANMLGALVGGLLQCITFVTGIKALLIVVALLYALAFAIRGRSPGADHDLAATAEPVV